MRLLLLFQKLKPILRSLLFILFFIIPQAGQGQYIGQFNNELKQSYKINAKASSFALNDIKLLDSPFLENMKRNGAWLLRVDINRLMHSWRINAGIGSKAEAFGNWEALDCELRGHTAGHVLSGLALMYNVTQNHAYKAKGDSIVKIMAQCQQVLNQNGYLSAFPQHFIDRCIAGQGVWAPWYTLHKVFAGLTDMYLYAGNKHALEVVTNMSKWAYQKLKPLSANQLAVMLKTEWGGMNESAYNLYAITGNPQDLELAGFFHEYRIMDNLAAEKDKLASLHANTQIPKITGEARGYELTGNEKQLKICNFFWNTVIENHTYCIGGNSDAEHFFEVDKWKDHIFNPRTAETCNTYNMLKLTRHLFTWTANVKYADYYEQALYNHILATQNPETGMASYFMPLKPGLFKVYSSETNSFWCCVGTGFESHAKYAEAIYYHNEKGLFVNLFIPSELNWSDKNVKIIQQTNYPEEPSTTLTIQTAKPVKMPLYVRYPAWATKGVKVKINGKSFRTIEKPGSFITIERTWKSGDKVEIVYPMELRLVAAPHTSGIAAIAYGPIILSGKMGTSGLVKPAPYAVRDQNEYNNYPIPEDVVSSLKTNGKPVAEWLIPVAGKPLEFVTKAGIAPREVTFIPYYKMHGERYVLYWTLK